MMGLRIDYRPLVAILALLVIVSSPALPAAAGATPASVEEPRLSGFLLRIARSEDGLSFADTGEVFLDSATAPDLVRLPNQDLLALFDYHDSPGTQDQPVLAVCRSSDDGATWSAPHPIRIEGTPADGTRLRYGSLVVMPSGFVRLYCYAVKPGDDLSDGVSERFIASAVTRNGLDYLIDPEVHIAVEGTAQGQPSAAWTGDHLSLLVAPRKEPGEADRASGTVLCYSSLDGRRFGAAERMRLVGLTGSIVAPEDQHLRLYFSYRNEILSMGSLNGTHWGHEMGVRLRNASDPAVVQLKDDRFCMLYVAPATEVSLELLVRNVLTVTDEADDPDTTGSTPKPDSRDTWKAFTYASIETELGSIAPITWDEP